MFLEDILTIKLTSTKTILIALVHLVCQIEEKKVRCNTYDFLTWITNTKKHNTDRKATANFLRYQEAPKVQRAMKGIKHQYLKVLSTSHNADPYPKAFLSWS